MIFYTCSPDEFGYKDKQYDSTNTQIKEEEDYFKIYLDLPGYSKEQISISLKDYTLNVEACSEERGTIKKSIPLGNQSDLEDITAKLENGILEIFVMKVHKVEKKIEIQ